MGEAALKLKPLRGEDYLCEEVARKLKHEYVDGQVYALAGASDNHNRVAGNIYFRIRQSLGKEGCRAYISDMKLRVQTELTHRFYYPDVMVTCSDGDTNELYKVAPCLLVEVTSPSTSSVDRREKLLAYQSVAELRDYLIVSADERYVERYRRDPEEGWWYHELREEATVNLPYLNLALTLDDVYEGLFR
jgi:Uma2 family endonuclease